jgi:hypothetical protein
LLLTTEQLIPPELVVVVEDELLELLELLLELEEVEPEVELLDELELLEDELELLERPPCGSMRQRVPAEMLVK